MKNKNILNKEESISINEKWLSTLISKYSKEFKEFFKLLKKQFKHNKNARKIISNYITNKEVSKEDSILLKGIITDQLKIVGLGSIAILPIPGATALLILLIKMAKKFNINLIPSQMIKEPELALEKKKNKKNKKD